MTTVSLVFANSSPVFAGQWSKDSVGWWWQEDNGSYPAGTWKWIDGDQDGTAECYYFNSDGYMLENTVTPDGYTVNAQGQWVSDGIVQAQSVRPETTEENAESSQTDTFTEPAGGYDEYGISYLAREMLTNSREQNAKYGETSAFDFDDGVMVDYANGFSVIYRNDQNGKAQCVDAASDNGKKALFRYYVPGMEDVHDILYHLSAECGLKFDQDDLYIADLTNTVFVDETRFSLMWFRDSVTLFPG